MAFSIPPGETMKLDATDLAAARGATAPPCGQLVWTVAWRATDVLSATWSHLGSVVELGRGRWGTADLGCATFELRNSGTVSVSGELAFVIGSR